MFSLFFTKKKSKKTIAKIPRPIILIIIDGFGISPIKEGNAVFNAKTPNLDFLQKHFPKTLLHSSGNEVGLPFGEFGNSEVGHLNIGSGRIVYQPLLRVTRSLESGELDKSKEAKEITDHLKKTKGALHLIGMLSAGGIHSHIEHVPYLFEWCAKNKIKKIFLHMFADGRDGPPASAENFIYEIEQKIKFLDPDVKFASISGRYYAMDRNKKWDRTKKAYDAILGISESKIPLAKEAILMAYAQNKTDEFIEPSTIIDDKGNPISKMSDGDAIIFFNFRPDRMRQITKAFSDRRFKNFKTKKFKKLLITSFTEYDPTFKINVFFGEKELTNSLPEILAKKNKKQFHISETEKYAHVTYFFSGGHEKPYSNEDRVIIPSPNVKTYDKKPEMSSEQITKRILEEIEKDKYDFFVVNFSNPDMVGHTGNYKATIKGTEIVDKHIGEIVKKTLQKEGAVLITSDHGNAEEMINFETNRKDVGHNIYPVPLILVEKELAKEKVSSSFKEAAFTPTGALADIAPTILDLMNIKKPEEMTGVSLLDSLV